MQLKQDFILVHGKGNKERVVPKSPFLAKVLFKYLNARNSYFQYRVLPPNVFVSRRAKPLTHEMIERVVKDAGKFAKVSKEVRISPHTCRHTYAQVQLRNGLDLYTCLLYTSRKLCSILLICLLAAGICAGKPAD